jgi:DNA-binding MarR family transcriptional regulator
MQHIELPGDYALVLQTVQENGEEDFGNLAETLRFDRQRLDHIVDALRHKGLIYLSKSTRSGSEAWIRVSSKGRKWMTNIWPESSVSGMSYGF